MGKPAEFKNKHYKAEIILLTVRWYLRYGLTYRHLTEMMAERGLSISHTTIMRWVHEYGPKLDQKLRKRLRMAGDSYRVDETYVRIKGRWYYLYRAVDKEGNTIDFLLSKHRDQLAAARFLKKALNAEHTVPPRVINTDENAAYGPAIESAKSVGALGKDVEHRKVKYLNNNIESDHRRVKKLIKYSLWLRSFRTAYKTIRGYEAMHMIMKGQMKNAKTSLEQKREIEGLFGLAA